MDSQSAVIDCPVCKRTMWANSTCHHGQVPPPRKGAAVEANEGPVPVLDAHGKHKRGKK